MPGTLVVGQSGGPTAVVNASLYGVVAEALQSRHVTRVLGARHGIEGVLGESFVDLGRQSADVLSALSGTPAAALGSCRYRLRDEDLDRVLRVFEKHDVRFFLYIGGNDSADTAHRIALAARARGYELMVVGIPKTIDNDLPCTDHCPGYGSAARFMALAAAGAGKDTEAMRRTDPVKIVEVMGRYSGWLAAASALGKYSELDAPHVVLFPERPLTVVSVVNAVKQAYEEFGYAVLVLCENQPGPDGTVLGAEGEPRYVDPFGHAYFDSPGLFLSRTIQQELGLRARYDRPGSIQRMFTESVSETDRAEAELVGRQAVRHALEGRTDEMVVLVRQDGDEYGCTTGTAPLDAIANAQKLLPDDYIDADGLKPSVAFHSYAWPLIGGSLPRYVRLEE